MPTNVWFPESPRVLYRGLSSDVSVLLLSFRGDSGINHKPRHICTGYWQQLVILWEIWQSEVSLSGDRRFRGCHVPLLRAQEGSGAEARITLLGFYFISDTDHTPVTCARGGVRENMHQEFQLKGRGERALNFETSHKFLGWLRPKAGAGRRHHAPCIRLAALSQAWIPSSSATNSQPHDFQLFNFQLFTVTTLWSWSKTYK